MSLESQLQARLLLVAPERFPDLRLFRRNIGAAKMKGGATVRFAIPGQADLYGMTRGGRHIECELKGVGKPLSTEQESWRSWCLGWKVPHIVLRALKGETEDATVERWCVELEALLRTL